MNHQNGTERLAAENLATQALLVGLLNSLASAGLGDIAETGFRYAELSLEATVLDIGDRLPAGHMIGALKVLEQLHGMYLPFENKPSG
jgi:hypothetical protein